MPGNAQLLWYILLIGAIGVSALSLGVLLARYFRKRLRQDDRVEAFTLQDLRELREQAAITPQEFETMRAAIIGQVTAAPTPKSPKNSPDDVEIEDNRDDPASETPPQNDPNQ